MVDPADRSGDEDEGPIGIFPNWWWLYGSVVLYTAALIALLRFFTVVFDHGTSAP